MGVLALLFIIVPIVELSLLVRIGARIGGLPTIALVIVTGVVGAALARWQGMGVIRQMKAELGQGHLPATSMVDGAIILVAGLLLITPGVLTDLVGLLLLLPPVRALVRGQVGERVKRAVEQQRVHVTSFGGPFRGPGGGPFGDPTAGPFVDTGDGVIIDGESEPVEPEEVNRLQPPRSE